VGLKAADGQETVVRDGVPALISKKQHVIVMRPISKTQASHGRPSFVLAVLNRGNRPVTMRVEDIQAISTKPKQIAIRIYTFEELTSEAQAQRNAQLTLALLSGVAGAVSASQAGYSHTTGSVYGANSYGSFSATTYNPAVAQMAANQNAAITASNMEGIQAQGEQRLAELQNTILKDHTLMPGEWHGGVIVLDEPEKGETGSAEYEIRVQLDSEVHAFNISQERSR
jgi:hypothetical protein